MLRKSKKQSGIAKKAVSVLLSVLMAASVGSAAIVSAGAIETSEVSSGDTFGDYEYSVLDDGTVEITDYNGSDTEIIIPSEIDGKSVTRIGQYAFENCKSLTSITIPNSVTSIGYRAFYDTAWYKNQPDGLVYAGKVAYAYKGEMPENTELILKDGTLGIADDAFTYCDNLTNITIPDSVKIIGNHAFDGCIGLTSITIPDSVTSTCN